MRYIYQKQFNEGCLQHDVVDGEFKDFPRRTASDEILDKKACDTAKNPKYDGYQYGLASVVYIIFW